MEGAPITNKSLIFYVEHISCIPENTSNTILKLVTTAEVNYNDLKAHVRQRIGITHNFELDYNPSRNHLHLIAFQHITRPEPCVWMYTVPVQVPGSAPWYLRNVIWTLLGPHLSSHHISFSQTNDHEPRNDRQHGSITGLDTENQQEPIQHTGALPQQHTDKHYITGTSLQIHINTEPQRRYINSQNLEVHDLLRIAYPGVQHPDTLQRVINNANPPPKLMDKKMYFRLFLVAMLTILYINWAMVIFSEILVLPKYQEFLFIASIFTAGYTIARRVTSNPVVANAKTIRNPV